MQTFPIFLSNGTVINSYREALGYLSYLDARDTRTFTENDTKSVRELTNLIQDKLPVGRPVFPYTAPNGKVLNSHKEAEDYMRFLDELKSEDCKDYFEYTRLMTVVYNDIDNLLLLLVLPKLLYLAYYNGTLSIHYFILFLGFYG